MAVTLPRTAPAYEVTAAGATGSRAWRRFALNPAAIVGSLILLVMVSAAVAAPWVAPHDPAKQSLLRRFTPPLWQAGGNATYPLGTDQVGRDVLSRIIHGARISLLVGVAAVLVSLVVGVSAGLASGFLGGKVDTVIGTIVDVWLSFPQLLLALAFVAALGPSLVTIIVVLGLTGWERYARVVRAEVLALREKEFIEAARAVGLSRPAIVTRHIVPNLLGPVVVYVTLTIPAVILAESFLSFLGLGVQPPMASLGTLIATGASDMELAPWLLIFPSAVMVLTLMSFNFIGDGLRDALDPKDR